MNRHIDFLGALLLVWSGVGLLVGFACLLLAFGAAAIFGSATAGETADFVLPVTVVALFVVFGLMAILLSGVHAGAGFGLRRRRQWSRPVSLALGMVDLILLPFGTALGVYALWVLLHSETRQIFHRHSA